MSPPGLARRGHFARSVGGVAEARCVTDGGRGSGEPSCVAEARPRAGGGGDAGVSHREPLAPWENPTRGLPARLASLRALSPVTTEQNARRGLSFPFLQNAFAPQLLDEQHAEEACGSRFALQKCQERQSGGHRVMGAAPVSLYLGFPARVGCAHRVGGWTAREASGRGRGGSAERWEAYSPALPTRAPP